MTRQKRGWLMTILKSFEKPLTPEEEVNYLTKFKDDKEDSANASRSYWYRQRR